MHGMVYNTVMQDGRYTVAMYYSIFNIEDSRKTIFNIDQMMIDDSNSNQSESGSFINCSVGITRTSSRMCWIQT